MNDSYTTILTDGCFTFEDRKSVFIGYAFPISEEADAQNKLAAIKKKHSDAKHHVYAYVLREGNTKRFSDDREPQGTAGMPVLDVLQKRGITDALIVVVRYFGGILLGTGGLVHAYTEAAAGAVNAGRPAQFITFTRFSLRVSYSDYSKISLLLNTERLVTESTDFEDAVAIRAKIPSEEFEDFAKQLAECTAGRAEIEKNDEIFDCFEK